MEKIRKGDDVIVLTGKDKGKRGSVLRRIDEDHVCLLYTSPSPRDRTRSRMPSSA